MVRHVSYITRVDKETGQMTSPDGKRKIFISYKHSDEMELPLCQRLASYILAQHDVAVWYDRQLTAGTQYDDEIQSAIRSSDAFVLLLSPTILSSKYILEQEIPFAQKNQVAIIPVLAGLSEKDIPEVEKVIGRVHMPLWFYDKRDTVPNFPSEALKQFQSGLSISIANKDLMSQVIRFYERGSHKTSLRYLSLEDIFMKAYGCLFGIGAEYDKIRGIKLMETILSSYGDDDEFLALQKQVSFELLKHFYRSNQPELFIAYLKPMLKKGFDNVLPLLFDAYRQQWHPEILCNEPELSMVLFEHFFRQYAPHPWDGDQTVRDTEHGNLLRPTVFQPSPSLPRIGEIVCGNHTAFFQRSETEERTVYLMLDDRCLEKYDVSAAFGDVSFLFLAYDAQRQLLVSLYADFDHYGPETYFSGKFFQLGSQEIRSSDFSFEAIKYLHQLPYSPHTFGFI